MHAGGENEDIYRNASLLSRLRPTRLLSFLPKSEPRSFWRRSFSVICGQEREIPSSKGREACTRPSPIYHQLLQRRKSSYTVEGLRDSQRETTPMMIGERNYMENEGRKRASRRKGVLFSGDGGRAARRLFAVCAHQGNLTDNRPSTTRGHPMLSSLFGKDSFTPLEWLSYEQWGPLVSLPSLFLVALGPGYLSHL